MQEMSQRLPTADKRGRARQRDGRRRCGNIVPTGPTLGRRHDIRPRSRAIAPAGGVAASAAPASRPDTCRGVHRLDIPRDAGRRSTRNSDTSKSCVRGYYRAGTRIPSPSCSQATHPSFRAIGRAALPGRRTSSPFSALLSRGDDGVRDRRRRDAGESRARPFHRHRRGGARVTKTVVVGAWPARGHQSGRQCHPARDHRQRGHQHGRATVAGSPPAPQVVDDWVVRVPLGLAQKLLRVSGANTWTVFSMNRCDRGGRGLRGPNARERLRSRPLDRARRLLQQDRCDIFTTGLVRAPGDAVIIVLSIANSMMMTIMERTGEVGTSLALASRAGACAADSDPGCARHDRRPRGRRWAPARVRHQRRRHPDAGAAGSAHGCIGGILTPRLVAESLALAVVTSTVASIYPRSRRRGCRSSTPCGATDDTRRHSFDASINDQARTAQSRAQRCAPA